MGRKIEPFTNTGIVLDRGIHDPDFYEPITPPAYQFDSAVQQLMI